MVRVTVLAFGSHHGDDRAAWHALDQIRPSLPRGTRAFALAEPLRLVDHTGACDRLVLVDACRSGRPPGSLVRLTWPDPALRDWGAVSSHGLGVGAALALAGSLGHLPAEVVLLGLEVGDDRPGEACSPPVRAALPGLVARVEQELRRPAVPAATVRQAPRALLPS